MIETKTAETRINRFEGIGLYYQNYKDVIERLFLFILIVIVAGFASYKFTESPAVWYDEGIYLQSAINWSEAGNLGIQTEPGVFISSSNSTVGFPLIYPVGISFDLFGVGVSQARAVMVGFLLLFVLSTYFFIKSLFGFRIAVMSSLLLATFPVLYGNGKSVLGEVPGMFFLTSFLFFVYKLEQSDFKGRTYYILAGLTGGLCVVTKPIFLILLPAILVAILLHRNKITFRVKDILISLLAFIIPVFIWIRTQFNDSDSLFDILAFYTTISNQSSVTSLMLDNIVRFLTELSPLFVLGTFLVWVASIFYRNFRVSFTETIAFFFFIIICVAYLRTPGWYRYFFPAQILGLIFLPIALYSIPYVKRIALCVVAILIIFNLYQLGFNSFVAEYYTSNRTETLENHFRSYDVDTRFFVYNAPEIVIFLPSRNYYQYMNPRQEQLIGSEQLVKITSGIPNIIVVLTQTYEEKSNEFALYKPQDRINRYTILSKI